MTFLRAEEDALQRNFCFVEILTLEIVRFNVKFRRTVAYFNK